MVAPARALKDGDFSKPNIGPKGETDTIAEAALIAEDPSTEKESGVKSAAPYLLINAPAAKPKYLGTPSIQSP